MKISPDDIEFARALARHTAGRYPTMDPEEAEGFGLLALVNAARRWRPTMKVKLTSYAYLRIVGAVHDHHRAWNHKSRRRDSAPVNVEFDPEVDGDHRRAMEVGPDLGKVFAILADMPAVDRDLVLRSATGELLDEVGDRHGLSRSWACRRDARALAAVRLRLGVAA
ncbi:MAG: sigma-70 family RNA polymerase sigma factor [Pseudomonadota bacterium]